eukprot:TRINITY_DN5147_c0_g2_i6.p1 TRINITY_DN5147_c0_g2~~TRINITY_DN5147_c0_g2_i6.p1  ORF type:complete len:271 (-),score=46.13 TRINITY_DN5147_c0_g2_i6:136-948(-)
MVQLAHFSAFKNTGLSNPTIAPSWHIPSLDQRHLDHQVHTFFKNVTIVATGANEEIRSLVESNLNQFKDRPINPELRDQPKIPGISEIYGPRGDFNFWNGSDVVVRQPGSTNSSHVLVTFPGCVKNASDFFSYSVFSEILNFSGVYDKYSGGAFQLAYDDAGLLGVYAKGSPGEAAQILKDVRKAVDEVKNTNGHVLVGAQNRVTLNYLTENQNPLLLARKLKNHGLRVLDLQTTLNSIRKVSLEDVGRVAETLSRVKPVVVVSGDVRGV